MNPPARTSPAPALAGTVAYLPSEHPDTPPGAPPPALPAALAPILPGRLGRTRRRLQRPVVVAALTASGLFLAATITVTAVTDTPPPTATAAAYATALTRHDTAALTALGICHNSPLCATGALDSGYQPPDHIHLGAATTAGDTATVPIAYTIDGTPHTDHIDLGRYRTGTLSHQWFITHAPGTVIHPHSNYWTTAQVANTTIATDAANRAASAPDVWAPPGQYTITTTGDTLINPATATITITDNPTSVRVDLEPSLRDGLTPAINQQIHDRIDQCATQASFYPTGPAGCPIRYDTIYTITENPHWTILQYPTVTLALHDDELPAFFRRSDVVVILVVLGSMVAGLCGPRPVTL